MRTVFMATLLLSAFSATAAMAQPNALWVGSWKSTTTGMPLLITPQILMLSGIATQWSEAIATDPKDCRFGYTSPSLSREAILQRLHRPGSAPAQTGTDDGAFRTVVANAARFSGDISPGNYRRLTVKCSAIKLSCMPYFIIDQKKILAVYDCPSLSALGLDEFEHVGAPAGITFASASAYVAPKTPEAFLTALFAPYANKQDRLSDLSDARADPKMVDRLLEPSLANLWHRYFGKKRDSPGGLDGDPVCACQENDVSGLAITVKSLGPNEAMGQAVFKIGSNTRIENFHLVSLNGTWFIRDIQDNEADSQSLRAVFESDLGLPHVILPPPGGQPVVSASSTATNTPGGQSAEPGVAGVAPTHNYENILSEKYGYKFSYPKDVLPITVRPDAGDGVTLKSADKSIEVRVSGSYNLAEETPAIFKAKAAKDENYKDKTIKVLRQSTNEIAIIRHIGNVDTYEMNLYRSAGPYLLVTYTVSATYPTVTSADNLGWIERISTDVRQTTGVIEAAAAQKKK